MATVRIQREDFDVAAEQQARVAMPPQRAAHCTGTQSIARSLRRETQAAPSPASQANIVTCRPLIDIRCATPVLRYRSQSSRWESTIKSYASTYSQIFFAKFFSQISGAMQ